METAVLVDSAGEARTGEDDEARKAAVNRLRATVMAYLDKWREKGRDMPLLNGIDAPEHLSAAEQAVWLARRGVDPFALPVGFLTDDEPESPRAAQGAPPDGTLSAPLDEPPSATAGGALVVLNSPPAVLNEPLSADDGCADAGATAGKTMSDDARFALALRHVAETYAWIAGRKV